MLILIYKTILMSSMLETSRLPEARLPSLSGYGGGNLQGQQKTEVVVGGIVAVSSTMTRERTALTLWLASLFGYIIRCDLHLALKYHRLDSTLPCLPDIGYLRLSLRNLG